MVGDVLAENEFWLGNMYLHIVYIVYNCTMKFESSTCTMKQQQQRRMHAILMTVRKWNKSSFIQTDKDTSEKKGQWNRVVYHVYCSTDFSSDKSEQVHYAAAVCLFLI